VHDYVLQASSCINQQIATLGIIPKFDTNLTSSRWKSQITRDAPSSQNQTPLSLVLSKFSELSYLGDFVAIDFASNNEPETICEVFYKTKHILHGLQIPMLDTIIG